MSPMTPSLDRPEAPRTITVLGSTGSIGTQTIELLAAEPERFQVRALVAGRKAGFKTVAVGTGVASWAELKRSRPDHLARDFRGVGKWLKWFGIQDSARRKRRTLPAA